MIDEQKFREFSEKAKQVTTMVFSPETRTYSISGMDGNTANFIAAANPAAILALLDELAALRAAVKQAREDALTDAQANLIDALVHDCENGVKWLSERAAADFKKFYPGVYAAIESLKGKP